MSDKKSNEIRPLLVDSNKKTDKERLRETMEEIRRDAIKKIEDFALKRHINDAPAWVIDCETTGVADSDRIVSFAAVEMRGPISTGNVINLIFNPGKNSHPVAKRIHGWENKVLQKQDDFSLHAADIRSKLDASELIVGHNIDFDIYYLNNELAIAGVERLRRPLYCTMYKYRDLYPRRKSKLDLCAREIGVKRSGKTHGALEDAFIAAALYSWLKYYSVDFVMPDSFPDPVNLKV